MSILRRLHNKAGTSLVEVLVTLVVFLVGIVSVVRIFPGGFFSMKHTENVAVANRLAQTELERWEGKSANLPGGILAWGESETPDVFTVYTDIDPDNLAEPIPPEGYYFTDVNRFRRIHGEATRIPVPSSANWSAGSIYVLAFSPVAWSSDVPNPDPILVYGGQMRRLSLPRDPEDLRLRRHSEYAIDYEKAELYLLAVDRLRNYIIHYSYWQDVSGTMTLMPAVSVSIPVVAATPRDIDQGYQLVRIPAPGGGDVSQMRGFQGIDYRSDSLHRQFTQLPVQTDGSVSWTDYDGDGEPDDPYEFALIDPVAGVLAFNPVGYGYTELTTRGKEPLVAYIDYTVLDWHIIREERKLPDYWTSPADLDTKLALRFIKKRDDTREFDGTVYGGLAPSFNLPYDVLAVDIETGMSCSEASTVAFVLGPDGSQISTSERPTMQVNYKEGIIRFDPAFANVKAGDPTVRSPFQGKTFRIYYRAQGDWAVQTFKAYEVYRRSNTPTLDHRQYYFENGKIYFPRCYAGCTVAVDYSYRLNNQQPDLYKSGEMYQISEGPDLVYNYCYIDIGSKLREVHGANAVIDFRRISTVYGVSVGVRVIWRETGRGFRAGSWRKVDLQTYLTRQSI